MKLDGYAFLGWVSSLDLKKDSTEWNNLYDVENDLYCTSNIAKAKPYLLTGDEIVQETFDVYPVYAKYNIITQVNIGQGGVAVNIPTVPEYTLEESATEKGIATISIVPDLDTYVMGSYGRKYELISLVRIYEDGTEEELSVSEDNTYKYTVDAGPTYTFVAKYEPFTVIYYLSGSEVKLILKDYLEKLGETPIPTYEIGKNDYIAIGWTDAIPDSKGYHSYEDYESYENAGLTLYTENTLNRCNRN